MENGSERREDKKGGVDGDSVDAADAADAADAGI